MREYCALGEVIRQGRMGTPLCLTVHYTGGLLHNGFHFLDLAHWFFGLPEEARIFPGHQKRNKSKDCSVTIRCTYKSGLQFNLIGVGYESPTPSRIHWLRRRLRISTTKESNGKRASPWNGVRGLGNYLRINTKKSKPGLLFPMHTVQLQSIWKRAFPSKGTPSHAWLLIT